MPTINLGNKPKREFNKSSNGENKKERAKFYSTEQWKKLRLAKLYEQPLCEVCKLKGMVENNEEKYLTLAEEVHHLRSFMKGANYNEQAMLFYDFNNLCSICKKCHSEIHTGNLKGCESLEEILDRLKFLKEEETDLHKYLYKGNND